MKTRSNLRPNRRTLHHELRRQSPKRPLGAGAALGLLGLMITAVATSACKGPSYIELNPTDIGFDRRGQSKQIKAKALDQQGHYYPEVLFNWKSEKPDVVSVDMKGFAKVVGSGTSFIYASANSLEARALVRVALIEKMEVLTPEVSLSLNEGERFLPEVVLTDNNGKKVQDRQIFFKPADAAVVSVDRQGGLWPQALGTTSVTASIEGFKGEIQVTVKK